MEKVFVTGRGLITPLGNGKAENEASLRCGKSGLVHIPDWAELNLDCTVAGKAAPFEVHPLLDRKRLRFCPPGAVMSVNAVAEALAEAGIALEEIPALRIAVVAGVAGSYFYEIFSNANAYNNSRRIRDVSPYVVPRVMPSSVVSNLSLVFGCHGETYDVSAACASGALAVIVATRLIRSGEYDIVIAGGSEQLDWVECLGFCAIKALSKHFNATPERASRPFDRDRDGFVLAEGAGYVVLESAGSVKRRGVRPITEIAGIAANSNASDMVVPDRAASEQVMLQAIHQAGLKPQDIGYVNTHGTATPVGDPIEMAALKNVFGSRIAINSTKSQTGHLIGATGAVEIIFTSLMLEKHFLSPSINLEQPDDNFDWADLVRVPREGVAIRHALSNSFAFGGSNACVILSDCGN